MIYNRNQTMTEANSRKISLLEIKKALKDSRFREKLPPYLKNEVIKFLSNPSCACNAPLYRKIATECGELLRQYYPNKEIGEEVIKEIDKEDGSWMVINCHVNELENNLRKIKYTKTNIAVARYEDQVTVIVKEIQ